MAAFFLVSCLPAAQEVPPLETTARAVSEMTIEDLLNARIDVASARARTIFSTPSTVTVITADMIRKYNFQTLAEALDVLAGFSVLRTASRQELATSRGILQDHYPNKVLFMIDGVPSWNSITGEMGPLNRVNVQDIERVEVLKGPASVLHGTNAYAGAVNVVLRKAAVDRFLFHGLVGDKGGLGACGNANVVGGDFRLFVSGGGRTEGGDGRTMADASGATGRFDDYVRYQNMTVSADYRNHHVMFNGYAEKQQKLGVEPLFSSAMGKPQDMKGYLAAYSNDWAVNKAFRWVNLFSFDWSAREFPRSPDLAVYTRLAAWRAQFESKGDYRFSDRLGADFGVDFDYRKSQYYRNLNVLTGQVLAENNLLGRSLYELSAYGQMTYDRGALSLVLGGRFTRNQRFGNDFSARGSLVYAFDPKNSVKLIVGQSYRSPSLFEVFIVTPARTVGGNLQLKPEKSACFEAAYLTSFRNFFFQVLAYHALYQDKIFRVDAPFATLPDGSTGTATCKIYKNGDTFRSNGVELEMRYQAGAVDFFANYGYVRGDDGDALPSSPEHYNFRYVPRHKLAAGFSANWRGIEGSVVFRLLGGTWGPFAPVGEQSRADASVGYSHRVSGTKLRHTFSVKDITGAEWRTPEYVERFLNDIPYWPNRRVAYTLTVEF